MHWRRLEVEPLEGVHELRGDEVGQAAQELAQLHCRAAQIAHGVEDLEGEAETRLGAFSFACLGVLEPAAHPVEKPGGGDLRLEGAKDGEAPEETARQRAILEPCCQLGEMPIYLPIVGPLFAFWQGGHEL